MTGAPLSDPLERAVIEALLAGDHPVLAQLRTQLAGATVRDRERGDYGQFTDLWIPDDAAPIAMTERFALDDVFARVEGCDEEAGFLLHVVRGRLKTLEAFVSRPHWPEAPTLVEHWYVAPHPDPDEAGQLTRVQRRDLDFALRGLLPREEED